MMSILTLISFNLYAGERVDVKVAGMVCAYCSNGVEKTFKKQDAVANVKVDLDTKIVSIELKDDARLSDEKVIELITNSGFNVHSIERK